MKIEIKDADNNTRKHPSLKSVRANERHGIVSLANLAARKIGKAQKAVVTNCGVSVTATR